MKKSSDLAIMQNKENKQILIFKHHSIEHISDTQLKNTFHLKLRLDQPFKIRNQALNLHLILNQ